MKIIAPYFNSRSNTFVDSFRQRLTRIHSKHQCKGRPCIVHNPSWHHMNTWPLYWRSDRFIFERICLHGVGHPDPDEMWFQISIGHEYEGIHGCDGCCHHE